MNGETYSSKNLHFVLKTQYQGVSLKIAETAISPRLPPQKKKLKHICFSTLKSFSFDKVEKKLSEAESLALKILIDRKDLVIQKADKEITLVITDQTKYLEEIKTLLSDSSKFMQLPTESGKWVNYIIN